MAKYEKYKDSGIPWLGMIPEHWEIKQLRSFLRLFSEKGHGDAQLLSVTREQGVIERDKEDKEENHNYVPEDLSGYKHILPGDFVINKMKAWQGSYAVSKYDGIVSPAYFTCKLSGVDNAFFSHAIRSKTYVGFFASYSKGIRVGQWDLDPKALKSIPFFLPPLAEQKKIVDYIESKTLKIDSYVAERERELRLLDELKQAQIAEAVTHGLNPDVKMKDSGIPWIGMIPEHWEMIKAKYVLKPRKIVVGSKSDTYDLLSLTLKGVIKRDMDNPTGKFPASFDSYQEVHNGDFVFCFFDNEETPRTVGLSEYNGMITGAYDVFECCNDNICPKFLLYYYLTIDDAKHMKPLYRGLRKTIPYDSFMRYRIPVPPLSEQQDIVDFIDNKCNNINSLIEELEAEIAYLKEYKQRLIADAVTGQIKVF